MKREVPTLLATSAVLTPARARRYARINDCLRCNQQRDRQQEAGMGNKIHEERDFDPTPPRHALYRRQPRTGSHVSSQKKMIIRLVASGAPGLLSPRRLSSRNSGPPLTREKSFFRK
jgi:hypothetical protein